VRFLFLFGVLFAAAASAAPRPGTFAWNYANRPVVAPLAGYEYVAVSPRGILAPGVADSLRAFGAGALVWVQPALAATKGVPVSGPEYPFDSAALELVKRHDALLKKPDGKPVPLSPRKTYGALVLDFRDSAFVDAYAALITSTLGGKARGVLLDYGCGDLSWAHLGVDESVWPAWRQGFIRLCERLRAAGLLVFVQCDRYPDDLAAVSDGAFFEQAGMSLNPLAKVWANTVAHPDRRMIVRVEGLTPRTRRAFATLSLMTGALFNWCDLRGDYGGGSKENRRDFEHFEMSVGPSGGTVDTLATDVYRRRFEHSIAVLNMSARPYVYQLTDMQRITIQANDGLVVEVRTDRRSTTFISNVGK
jgi:hypothetical protein